MRHSKLNNIACALVESTSRYPLINVKNSNAHHSSQIIIRPSAPVLKYALIPLKVSIVGQNNISWISASPYFYSTYESTTMFNMVDTDCARGGPMIPISKTSTNR